MLKFYQYRPTHILFTAGHLVVQHGGGGGASEYQAGDALHTQGEGGKIGGYPGLPHFIFLCTFSILNPETVCIGKFQVPKQKQKQKN